MDDAAGAVEVAPLEREPLLGSEASPGGEDDERPERAELVRHRLDVGPRSNGWISFRFGSGTRDELRRERWLDPGKRRGQPPVNYPRPPVGLQAKPGTPT